MELAEVGRARTLNILVVWRTGKGKYFFVLFNHLKLPDSLSEHTKATNQAHIDIDRSILLSRLKILLNKALLLCTHFFVLGLPKRERLNTLLEKAPL